MPDVIVERGAWPAALLREIPCAAVAVDSMGIVTQWNLAAERLLGWSASEAVGRSIENVLGGPLLEGSRRCRHRSGRAVDAIITRSVTLSSDIETGYFLEPQIHLIDAVTRVVRDVLHTLPAYFSIIGPDLRYRLCCRSCEVLYGRSRRDIEGQLVADLLGPDATRQVAPLVAQAMSGTAAQGEFELLGADKRMHVLRVHLQPLRPFCDDVEGVFAFAYDVTEHRRTEADLRNSESRMKFLIEHNPDLITIVGRDHRIRFINHTEPDPSTRTEELIGIDAIRLSPPEYREWLTDQYDVVWRTGKMIDLEVPIVWRDQIRWFSSRLVALPNGDQPPTEILVVSRETTQRVQTEHALRESETRFRQFAEALDDVIWIHDTKPERIIFANESFERVWGVPRQRLYNDPRAWIESIHLEDRDRVRSLWTTVMKSSSVNFDIEYRIIRPDGSLRWIHDYGVAIRDTDGQPVRLTGIARDITARKLADEEREIFQRQLLETQKLESLGVLAGGIAHDFNNLLAGILGNVNLAQTGASADSSLGTHLEQIETIALRAGDLCKQMLAYAGKGQFIVTSIDLNTLIDDTTHLLSISISKKVSLQFHHTANLPAVRGDASQIRQVLLNLVINASEAFGDRVGLIRISTGVTDLTEEDLASFHFGSELSPGPYLFLEVSDNGPGMSPEVLSRIFEPFFTTKFTGRGLGLAAVQGIMRSHDGAVRVTSKPGRGTAFTLILPPIDEVALVEPPAPTVTGFRGKGTVLIADDEAIISSSLALMLESFGFSVVIANNGREAVDLFLRHRDEISIVLLDLTMPVLSGEEAFHELHRIDPAIPVIFMSGYMENELVDRFQDHAFAGFLQKPFRMDALEHLIAKALASVGK